MTFPTLPLTKPNITDYLVFIRSVMGINTTVLSDASLSIPFSLAVAQEIVTLDLAQISPMMFSLATYNLAGDRLLNYAQDLPGAANVPGSTPPAPFFAAARQSYGINSFVAGIIQEAHDESTGESMKINEAQQLTLMDLQNLKTPYGRAYLQLVQNLGSLWGLN